MSKTLSNVKDLGIEVFWFIIEQVFDSRSIWIMTWQFLDFSKEFKGRIRTTTFTDSVPGIYFECLGFKRKSRGE